MSGRGDRSQKSPGTWVTYGDDRACRTRLQSARCARASGRASAARSRRSRSHRRSPRGRRIHRHRRSIVHPAAVPADAAIGADVPDLETIRVLERRQPIGQRARRRRVVRRRRRLVECLVRRGGRARSARGGCRGGPSRPRGSTSVRIRFGSPYSLPLSAEPLGGRELFPQACRAVERHHDQSYPRGLNS
jgi:hypothetical protein